MGTPICILALMATVVGCASTPAAPPVTTAACERTPEVMAQVRYVEGGDRCDARAISIVGSPCTRVTVEAEHRWLAEHYPGYIVTHHALASNVVGSPCPYSRYSVFTIALPDQQVKYVTFEISNPWQ